MKKFFTAALALLLAVTMLPMSAFATANYDTSLSGCDFYNLIEKNDYALAPGAVESEIILNDDTGSNRNVLHVIEVDLKNPNISVMPTYMGLNENSNFEDSAQWGAQPLTEQAAHVENDLGLNVVGGMNTCLRYNNNHPYGVLVWNGKVYSDERDAKGASTAQTFLAVSADGTASLHGASEPIPEGTQQAISANFGWIIKDGVSQYSDDHADSGRAPRSVLAIKESGELVILMNDGRQAPYSAGATMGELAEWLLAMGCVDAVNCDGGGSSTFISEREGTGELTMKSSPSDGSERATLGGILVVSKAVADGKFDHATVKSSESYVTPGSTVEFTATGADSAGGPAEVPADATWQLADASMGTVENGVFKSNGTTGTATVQLVYNGVVAGEDSVEVVNPTQVKFTMDNITVPFGKSLPFEVVATVNDGINTVTTQDGDFVFTLSDDALGSMNGNVFTAVSESDVTEGTVTVAYKDTDVKATANLYLGRGSEVVYDFEDGSTKNITWQSGYLARSAVGRGETGTMEVVTAENGKVHSGDKALKLVADFSRGTAAGYREMRLNNLGIDLTDAVSVGMWIYMPTDAIGYDSRWLNVAGKQIGTGVAFGEVGTKYAEEGWYYVSIPVTSEHGDLQGLRMGVNDVNEDDAWNWFGKYTFYIDDITVDYSSAVEDREAPVFSNVYVSYGESEASSVMSGQTVPSNVVTVYANVFENTAKSNYTGINVLSAKVYVDGKELTSGFTYSSDGRINIVDINLSNGTHTFKFEIADNAGNTSSITRQVVINNVNGDVRFVPATPEAEKVPIGSIQYFNLVADNIENIDTVSAVIDLDSMSKWELEGIETASGFKATYEIDADTNTATVNVKKTGKVVATGEAVLAKIPARTWESTFHLYNNNPELVTDNPSNQDKAMILTPHAMWYSDGMWKVAIIAQAESIDVTYVDNSTDTFSSEEYLISSELYYHYSKRPESRKNEWSWHVHTPVATTDKAPTCTEEGYTGRTVCAGCSCGTVENLGKECTTHAGCGSVVDWGTVVPVTGHTYQYVNGQVTCKDCGDVDTKYTGLFKDVNGWMYLLEGKAATSWINLEDGWHYFKSNGYAAVGTLKIDGREYKFEGEQGKAIGAWDGKKYYYCHRYYKQTWATIEGEKYYFDHLGEYQTGITTIGTTAYEFTEDGKLIAPMNGVFYEPTYGYYAYAIDGKMQYDTGLIEWNGDYYYVRPNGRLITWATYVSAEKTNGLLDPGNYTFGEDGKLIMRDGVAYDDFGKLCYYINGVQQYDNGLVEWNGDYYYVRPNGLILTWASYVSEEKANGLVDPGNYSFGEDGKMVMRHGVAEDDFGKLCYYINGAQQYDCGLVEWNGDYYYVRPNGLILTWATYVTEEKANGLLDPGNYSFGEDGKLIMRKGVALDDFGKLCYYINGVQQYDSGLVEWEGDYYYVRPNGLILTWGTYVSAEKANGLVEPGDYEFGADGKMVK